jgi:hypothetical protein
MNLAQSLFQEAVLNDAIELARKVGQDWNALGADEQQIYLGAARHALGEYLATQGMV